MGIRGRLHRLGAVELSRVWSHEEWPGDRHEDEGRDDHEARRREFVMEEKKQELPESHQIERGAFAERCGPPARLGDNRRRQSHASRTRGSRYRYRTSATAFATTTPRVATRNTPDKRGKSRTRVASHVS